MTLQEELRSAYAAFRKGQAGLAVNTHQALGPGSSVEVLWVEMSSTGRACLLVEDQGIRENISFSFPLFSPGPGPPASRCLILGHGFNESDYIKLFPWAYCLCKGLGVPVIIFPCAFHMNRRPAAWIRLGRIHHHRRRLLPGNRLSSPFNAVVSQRISEAPERFFRGALQSYGDLMDLLRRIRDGTLYAQGPNGEVRPLGQGTAPDFLGYSISGYLFLGTLLEDRDSWLEESLLVLFNSFCAWDEANPVSVLVVDREAYDRGTRFYLEDYRREASDGFLALYEETEEGILFRRLFLRAAGGPPLREEVARLRERILIIADPHDPVFPGHAVGGHLGHEIPSVLLTLGRHEFPFNIPRAEEVGLVKLARAMRESWAPSARYEGLFLHWLCLVKDFLGSRKPLPCPKVNREPQGEPPRTLSRALWRYSM